VSHWQYLEHVEPILPTSRSAVPRYVEPSLSTTPPARRAFPLAAIVAVSVLVAPVAAPAVTLSWHAPLSEPVTIRRTVPDVCTGSERPLEVPRSQHLTWAPVLYHPVVRAQRVVTGDTGAERPVEIPESQHVTWLPVGHQPVDRARRVVTVDTGAERPLEVPRSQHVTWWPRVDGPPPPAQRTITVETGAESPRHIVRQSPVSWYVPLSEPVRTPPHLPVWTVAEAPVRVAPIVVSLAWAVPVDAPPLRVRWVPDPRVASDPIHLSAAVPVSIAWMAPLGEPLRPRHQLTIGTGADAPTRVLPTDVIPPSNVDITGTYIDAIAFTGTYVANVPISGTYIAGLSIIGEWETE
jgi:hypothetical protein